MALLSTSTETGAGHQTDADPIPSHQTLATRYNLGQLRDAGYAGALSVSTGTDHLVFPVAALIVGVSVAVDTAPTGAAAIIDVHKLNTSAADQGSLWATTQANRPTIAASAKRDSPIETAPDENDSLAAGEALRIDIDQVGSTVAGADLVVTVRYVLG